MINYTSPPEQYLEADFGRIASFEKDVNPNADAKTVNSFSGEWVKFNSFSQGEIQKIGEHYFDVLPKKIDDFVALDVGGGTGRWAAYLAPRVKFVEVIDPSDAVYSAQKLLKPYGNTRITHASTETIPFDNGTFDLVYCLGVLHHIPDTQKAMQQCYEKTKRGGYFLVYLYYSLDNRSILFRFLLIPVNLFRQIIHRLPSAIKLVVCDVIATTVYWPLAKVSQIFDQISFTKFFVKSIPLSYYRTMSFHIMRNDALDRFGTPLEKRFSKKEIQLMLERVGFHNITFSDKQPYWHALAQRP